MKLGLVRIKPRDPIANLSSDDVQIVDPLFSITLLTISSVVFDVTNIMIYMLKIIKHNTYTIRHSDKSRMQSAQCTRDHGPCNRNTAGTQNKHQRTCQTYRFTYKYKSWY